MNLDYSQIKAQAKQYIAGNKFLGLFLIELIILAIVGGTSYIGIGVLLGFLGIALDGVHLVFIRNPQLKLGEGIEYVFKTSFDNTFGKRLGLYLLQTLLASLLSILFVIPGIIFGIRYFFVNFVMVDCPDKSIGEVRDMAKRMTDGHYGEIFVLMIRFMLIGLLIAITGGLASIYLLPYISVVKAMYYEGFKARAIQEGKLAPEEFVVYAQAQPQQPYSPQQAYADPYAQQQAYAQPQPEAPAYTDPYAQQAYAQPQPEAPAYADPYAQQAYAQPQPEAPAYADPYAQQAYAQPQPEAQPYADPAAQPQDPNYPAQ